MLKKLGSLVIIFIIGCGPIQINETKTSAKSVEVSFIYDSMKSDNVSKEDAETLYKNFVGLVMYLPHSSKLDTTNKVLQIVKDFQTEYGYERGKYKSFTDSVEKHLTNCGYKKPMKITKELDNDDKTVDLSKVVEDFRVISDNCEKYLKELK